jgi:phosphomannomutase
VAGQPIISVSGLRGVVGETLTDDVVARYVAAFAAGLPDGRIVLTRDGRPSGAAFAAVIARTLAGGGHDVLDAGVAATPTTGVLVRRQAAVGGVQVSASHNPAQYNGLKLFDAEGRVLSAARGQRVLEAYQRGAYQSGETRTPPIEHGAIARCNDTTGDHLRLVLDTVDAAAIRARTFRVLLDVNHGAGGLLGRRILEALGCSVRILGETPDGAFEHPPEPLAENLQQVGRSVIEFAADVGFCQDPDADRLAVIDEQGRYVGEEYTLALCLDQVLRTRPGTVVTNCATSRMADDVAARHDSRVVRSAVGEANVVEAMLAHDAVFGGEGNGGPIDPRVGYVRDSFVGMAQILAAIASRREPVSRLVDELPRYYILKVKISLDRERIPAALDALARHFRDARADRLDGLRLDWSDRWLLVRASNTEPIARIICEASSEALAYATVSEAASVLDATII